jgi:hypothetical protein
LLPALLICLLETLISLTLQLCLMLAVSQLISESPTLGFRPTFPLISFSLLPLSLRLTVSLRQTLPF